jgi:geranylgeranyl pyrophosphate synthase
VTALRDYGHLLGTGFQIMDDVLDFRGDQDVLGKPVGSDLREGIVTLPVLYYVRAHPDDEKVPSVVRDASDDDLVRQVVNAIRESGAVDQAIERARDFIVRSKAALAPLPESESRTMMLDLADYVIARRK